MINQILKSFRVQLFWSASSFYEITPSSEGETLVKGFDLPGQTMVIQHRHKRVRVKLFHIKHALARPVPVAISAAPIIAGTPVV